VRGTQGTQRKQKAGESEIAKNERGKRAWGVTSKRARGKGMTRVRGERWARGPLPLEAQRKGQWRLTIFGRCLFCVALSRQLFSFLQDRKSPYIPQS